MYILQSTLIFFLTMGILTMPEQQSELILKEERETWQAQSQQFTSSQLNTFILSTTAIFSTGTINGGSVGMRGKAYPFAEGRTVMNSEIGYEDALKVYVYDEKGLIVGTCQFFYTFAFHFPASHSQSYRILFTGGRPGPQKLIIWQMDYQPLQPSPLTPNILAAHNTRLQAMLASFHQWKAYSDVEYLHWVASGEAIYDATFQYITYLLIQSLVCLALSISQVKVLQRIVQPGMII